MHFKKLTPIFCIFILLAFTVYAGTISFTNPTRANNTKTPDTTIVSNVSIVEQNLNKVIWNWNGTNTTIFDNNLLLMMNFDKVTALGENATKIVDVSSKGNNGTFVFASGTSAWTSSGKYGGAWNFDGAGNDYIQITDISKLNLTTNMTISAWIKVVGFGNTPRIIDKGPTTDRYFITLGLNDGTLIGGFGNGNYYQTTSALSLNQWYHIIATNNGNVTTFYVNGRLWPSSSIGPWGGTDVASLYIGNRYRLSVYDRTFNGSIDELRIWNRSISPAEVYQNYISNLNKFNQTQWYLYVNQSKNATAGLDYGVYTYYAFAANSTSSNQTETRTITIGLNNLPVMNFSNITSNQYPILSNSTLLGWCNATDTDSSSLFYNYKWYKNSILFSSGSTESSYPQGVLVNVANLTPSTESYHAPTQTNSYINATSLNGSWGIDYSNGFIYIVSTNGRSLTTFNASNPAAPVQTDFYSNSTSLATVQEVTVSNGFAYATAYGADSLTIFNLSNPSRPVQTKAYVNTTSLHGIRSVKIINELAYVVSSTASSLTVLNVSNPNTPVQIYYYSNVTSLNGADSIAIRNGFAYITSISGNSLTTFNLSNPAAPVQIAQYTNATSLNVPRYVVVSNGFAYVVSSTGKSLTTFNLSNPAAPVQTDYYTNATSLNAPWNLAVNNGIAYVTNYNGQSLTTFNLSNPSKPVQIDYYNNSASLDGAGGIIISNGFAYVASYNSKSLTTFNLSSFSPTFAVDQNWSLSCQANDGYDVSSYLNSSQTSITVAEDTTAPLINFTAPTPANAITTTNTSIKINVSITEANLDRLIYNWNGTNYTFYGDDLVLMMNMDNVSTLGENYDNNPLIYDASAYSNHGNHSSYVINISYDMDDGVTENEYLYINISSLGGMGGYTIQSGDYLEYDIYWTDSNAQIGIDYTLTNGTTLRAAEAVDQNGINARPGAEIQNYSTNNWYRRKIALPHVGGIINWFDIACEANEDANHTAYLDNIMITDGAGTVRKLIYNGAAPLDYSIHLQRDGSLRWIKNSTFTSLPNPTTGKYKLGLNFDGVDDYVKISDRTSIKPIKITYMAWIKPNQNYTKDSTTIPHIISKQGTGIGYNIFYESRNGAGAADGSIRFTLGNGSFYQGHYNINLSTENWYHVAVTHNGTRQALYINGILVNYTSDTFTLAHTTNPLYLGNCPDCGLTNTQFNGSIDEVRIWNRSLTADEIYQQYASNLNKYDTDKWSLYINQSKNSTTGLDDGTYTYYTYAADDNNNINQTETRTITIGTTQITITNTTSTPTLPITNNGTEQNLSINFTSNDYPINITFQLYYSNGTLADTQGPTTINNASELPITYTIPDTLEDGTFNLNMTATDSSGNNDTTALGNFTIDSTPPTASDITTNPTLPLNNNGEEQNISINFTSSEYPINITFNIYNSTGNIVDTIGPLTLNTSTDLPINYTIPGTLEDGTYNLNLTITDPTGNTNTTNLGNFTIDSTPPTASDITTNPTLPLNNNGEEQNISINFTSSEYPINITFNIYNSTGDLINTIGPTTINNASELPINYEINNTLPDGTYNLNLTLTDPTGNTNTTALGNFTIDSTPPTITNPTTNPTLPLNNNGEEQNISINFTSSEYPINITFNIYNSTGDLINTQGPTTINNASELPINYEINNSLPDGTYNLNLTLTDPTGNTNTTALGNFTVDSGPPPANDTTAPTVNLVSPTNGQTINNTNNITFTISATDNTDLDNCTLYTNITGWQANETKTFTGTSDSNTWNTYNLNNGTYIWNAYCCDNSSNCAWNNTNSTLHINLTTTCTPNLTNTTWTDWTNITCLSNDKMNQTRNLTQYDNNNCGGTNTTFTEYRTTEDCDYCTPNLTNTTWTAWYNISSCYANNTIDQTRNLTQYDNNNCGEITNTTYYEYNTTNCTYIPPPANDSTPPTVNLVSPTNGQTINNTNNITFTISATDNTDLDNCTLYTNITGWQANETKTFTGTSDSNTWNTYNLNNGTYIWNAYCCDNSSNCAWNNTNSTLHINLTTTCTPNLTNTTWTDWTNITCLSNDKMNQTRNLTQYDNNNCGGTNTTFTEYRTTEDCDYCTPNLTNTTWTDWYNTSECYANNTIDQTRNLTQYDNNNCGEITNTTYYEYNTTNCTYFIDTDGDGVSDTTDTLEWTEANVTISGFSVLNITVGGNSTDGTFSGEQEVLFYDGTDLMINFTHNFSESEIDLSRISIEITPLSIVVNLSSQLLPGEKKDLYVTDNSFVTLCVSDAEIETVSQISAACDGANETVFTACLGNSTGIRNGSITCYDLGSTIKITNLTNSGIRGTQAAASTTPSGGGGGGGGSKRECEDRIDNDGDGQIDMADPGCATYWDDDESDEVIVQCTQEWYCHPWTTCNKEGKRYRYCVDLNRCNNESEKPDIEEACTFTAPIEEKIEEGKADHLVVNETVEEAEKEPEKPTAVIRSESYLRIRSLLYRCSIPLGLLLLLLLLIFLVREWIIARRRYYYYNLKPVKISGIARTTRKIKDILIFIFINRMKQDDISKIIRTFKKIDKKYLSLISTTKTKEIKDWENIKKLKEDIKNIKADLEKNEKNFNITDKQKREIQNKAEKIKDDYNKIFEIRTDIKYIKRYSKFYTHEESYYKRQTLKALKRLRKIRENIAIYKRKLLNLNVRKRQQLYAKLEKDIEKRRR